MTKQFPLEQLLKADITYMSAGVPSAAAIAQVVPFDDHYEIVAPLKGYAPQDVLILCSDSVLSIKAERRMGPSEDRDDLYAADSFGAVSYNVGLPADLDVDTLAVSFVGDTLIIAADRCGRSARH
jgi:HSP20 family molecular chaperone IbpA